MRDEFPLGKVDRIAKELFGRVQAQPPMQPNVVHESDKPRTNFNSRDLRGYGSCRASVPLRLRYRWQPGARYQHATWDSAAFTAY